ncbi:MAG TPA: glycoside hydrolase family 6 protein [Candidatus Paceibacterota bacterium]|nr:glycoside hydrolase family 6 protein [Candidatus Paceibacterota bacterium]
MNKLLSVLSALTLAILASASLYLSAIPVQASVAVNAWWPTQDASVTGVQPFKAVVPGMDLQNYYMFWQVDNGGYVMMNDSTTDAPHKEAQVDISGWNWNPNGTYTVNFIAQDLSGHEIGRTSVVIKHGAPTAETAPSITNPTAPAIVTPVAATAPAAIATQANPATTVTARLAINVWWPTPNSNLTGIQLVKAALGSNLGAYKIYWSVDGGGQTELSDSYNPIPHKEGQIDFTSWHWKGNGTYTLTFTAKDLAGNVIGTKDVSVYVNASTATPAAPAAQPVQQIVAAPAPVQTQTVTGTKLFVDSNNPAAAQANAWASSDPTDAAIMAKIGAQPTGIWLGGWNSNVQADVAKNMSKATAANAIPTFVAYNIPGRDCGSYSAGGASDSSSYISWIKQVSAGLGSGKAILILEPDGLASIDCLSGQNQTDRYSMLSQALDIFKANNPGTKVYLDAGNSGWIDASTMASRLEKAGIAKAAGFALNVSNFFTTADNTAYGEKVSAQTNGAHFVIDTSRNGNGSNNGEWCNPSGMALGATPTLSTDNSLLDALLWVKQPGESDGNCNGAPAAGGWWPAYALGLAKAANWY